MEHARREKAGVVCYTKNLFRNFPTEKDSSLGSEVAIHKTPEPSNNKGKVTSSPTRKNSAHHSPQKPRSCSKERSKPTCRKRSYSSTQHSRQGQQTKNLAKKYQINQQIPVKVYQPESFRVGKTTRESRIKDNIRDWHQQLSTF